MQRAGSLLAGGSAAQPQAFLWEQESLRLPLHEPKGWVFCVWTIWPGCYIPQKLSITGLGRVEKGHRDNILLFSFNYLRGKRSTTFFKTFSSLSTCKAGSPS